MNIITIIFALLGAVCMFLTLFFRRRRYGFNIRNTLLLTIWLTFAGFSGVMLLFALENGSFGGMSFFGAVLLVPLFLFPWAKLSSVPFAKLTDYCAPAGCIMLAVMRLNCLYRGCCYGIVIHREGIHVTRFPSQLTELTAALAVFALLIILERKPFNSKKIYPYFMIFYGASRFLLNPLREQQDAFIGSWSAGWVWSVVCIIIGAITLIIQKHLIHTEK